MKPNTRIPVLVLDDGRTLAESSAILNVLADGSELLPPDQLLRAQVLQWQFFEQYSHEPYIGTARYINKYLACPTHVVPNLMKNKMEGIRRYL
jgi:glutathione S-transferase